MPKVEKRKATSRVAPIRARPSLETEIRQSHDTGILRPIRAPAREPAVDRAGSGTVRAGVRRPEAEGAKQDQQDEDDESDSGMLPQALSRKIMRQAQSQQLEEEEAKESYDDDAEPQQVPRQQSKRAREEEAFRLRDESTLSDDNDDGADDESVLADDEEVEELELSAEDETALAQFLPSSLSTRRNLADLILAKLDQHTAAVSGAAEDAPRPPLGAKVVAVYTNIGVVLSHYTSGKIPRLFKIVPTLRDWEEVLAVTQPDKWTPAAVSAATKYFASSTDLIAQRYYSLVVLPRVRRDIAEHGKLNYHLYQTLRRALFRTVSFLRGVLLPLASGECDDGEMTKREAEILSSVLAKYSVPPLHAAVCMLLLMQMPFSTPVMLLILTLIKKKYALPSSVIDELSVWFGKGAQDGGLDERGKVRMPLQWHQALLDFVQKYGAELSSEQAKRIRDVTRKQVHSGITREVVLELNRAKESRAERRPQGIVGEAKGALSVVNTPASTISVFSAGRLKPTPMQL